MSKLAPDAAPPAALPRHLPLLLLLFVGSGAAALIYEIVWFQMLELVIGSSGISLAVLLGTFMGGMCLGSLALPRFVSRQVHPLRVYAALEAGVGVSALILLAVIPQVGGIYSSLVGHGLGSVLLRALICALLLLPPTILMGATLPAISRWIETTPVGVSWMGFFYGGNIAGAVLGSLLAGFYLLRVYDVATATFAAVTIDATVALAGVALARAAPRAVSAAPATTEPVFAAGSRLIYITIGLSGLTALGAEVVWTRLLSLLLGATVYTFSIILAVFLVGLGLGSGVGSALARTIRRPRLALGLCQLSLTLGVAWTAYMLARSLPYWPINPSLTANPWFIFQIDLARTLWAIFPATLFWGASFPLAVAAAATPGQDPARLVGGVYAANTIGAILGSLGFAMLAIPQIGTQQSQRALIGLAAVSALLMLATAHGAAAGPMAGALPQGEPEHRTDRERSGAPPTTPAMPPHRWLARAGFALAILVLGGLLARTVPPVPPVLVAYGRYAPTYDPPDALYVGEGMNASVAVTLLDNGVRNFHVSGKVEASTEPQDMRLQRMLGHIGALLDRGPRSILVVGFGAGVTAGTFVGYPSVQRIVICEIEPLIPRVVAHYFGDVNDDVLHDPRVQVVYDDARHYILTTKEKFDVITSDPIHPWVKGAATLYSKEYFDLVKKHLNPGGVVTQWVPLYESTPDVVRSELATFFQAFPDGTVWGNTENGRGYDIVLAGQDGSPHIDLDRIDQTLDRPDYAGVVQSLSQVGFWSPEDLFATYAGYGPALAPWLQGAEVNRDRSLHLMYLAGMGLNLYQNAAIYDDMLHYWHLPDSLFTGTPDRVDHMKSKLMISRESH